jgi:hypothetical protein
MGAWLGAGRKKRATAVSERVREFSGRAKKNLFNLYLHFPRALGLEACSSSGTKCFMARVIYI